VNQEVIPDTALAGFDLGRVDCVWLCDVGRLEPATQQRLIQYVERGGGLIISAGEQTSLESWNDWRDGEGQPWLPVNALGMATASETGSASFGFETGPIPHPVAAAFAGNPDAGLGSTRIRQYVEAEVRSPQHAGIVLEFSHGKPAIVEQRAGQGRVAVVLTAADDRWGNWAVWPSFPPLVHSLVVHVAAGMGENWGLTVGEPVERTLPPAQGQAEMAITGPTGRRSVILPQCTTAGCRVVSEPCTAAGFYHLEMGPPLSRQEVIAVNPDPAESIPVRIPESRIGGELLPKGRFTTGLDEDARGRGGIASVIPGSAAGNLVALALVMLLLEQWLAWNTRMGLAALAGVIIVGTVWALAHFSGWSAAAGLMMMGAAAAVLQVRGTLARISRDR
jgi:hypothetical protein